MGDVEPIEREEMPRFVELVQFEPDEPEGDDGLDSAVLVRGFSGQAFALATVDEETGVWYLARGGSMGNPMRTRGHASTMTWSEPGLVREWLARLPDRVKAEMMRRQIFIVPVRLSILFDGSFERVTFTTRKVDPDPANPDAATIEYELGTKPLPLRRRRPKRRPQRHDDGGRSP